MENLSFSQQILQKIFLPKNTDLKILYCNRYTP